MGFVKGKVLLNNGTTLSSPATMVITVSRLIDFGLARELGGMDKVKCAMVGTLEFMAPEVTLYCTVLNCQQSKPTAGISHANSTLDKSSRQNNLFGYHT